MSSRLAALALGVAVVGGLVSCSGQDTREDFIRQGDAVCERQQSQIVQLVGSEPRQLTPETLPQFAAVFGRLRVLFAQRLAGLRNLDPPAADASRVERLLGDLDSFVDVLGQSEQAARSGDTAGLASLAERGSALSDRVNDGFRAYGFDVCGG